MIITEIFNFASMMDLIVYHRYQPIYYLLGFLSTGARGQLLSAKSEGGRSVVTLLTLIFYFPSGPLLLLCFLIDPALWSAWEGYSTRKQAERRLKAAGNPVTSEAVVSTATLTPAQNSDFDSIFTC